MENYADLTREAAALEPAVRFAKVLTNPQELRSLDVTPDQWVALLRQFGRCLASRGDPAAPAPEQVCKQLKDRISHATLCGQARLGEFVGWLVAGLYRPMRDTGSLTDVARRCLSDGRG